MNPKLTEYHCWIAGRRDETQYIVTASSPWEARKRMAAAHGRPVIEAIAHRVLSGATVKRAAR